MMFYVPYRLNSFNESLNAVDNVIRIFVEIMREILILFRRYDLVDLYKFCAYPFQMYNIDG